MNTKQYHTNFVEQKLYETVPFNEEEKNLLISSGVLSQLRNNQFVFQIVGAAVIGRKVIYIVPKFESDSDQSATTGIFYIQAIKQYLLSGSKRSSVMPMLDNVPLIMRTFEELNSYYIKFGVYKERKNVHISSETCQTNWPKTIIKNQALFSNIPDQNTLLQSVLYAEPIITTYNSYEGEVSRLFRNVLALLATFISPIMRIRHPLELRTSIDKISDSVSKIFDKSVYYRRILRAHISAEAGARKRLLKVLYNFLSSDSDELARIFGRRIFVFGTQNFELIWEDACLSVIGAQRGNKDLAQPRVSSGTVKIGFQRTDGIIYPNNEINKVAIVDAKYYAAYEAEPISLPVGDVMKQFGYSVSARATWPRHMIQNFMIFPHSSDAAERVIIVGTINLEKYGVLVKDFDPIVLLKVKPSEVFSYYIKKSINYWLKNFVISNDDLAVFSGSIKVFKARIGDTSSKIEVDAKGVATLKAGSTFKSGQSIRNKPCPRGFPMVDTWNNARTVITSIFVKQLVSKEKSNIFRLKSDFDCRSIDVVTLVVSGMDPDVRSDIWIEHGLDA